jgi:hypothetical protein
MYNKLKQASSSSLSLTMPKGDVLWDPVQARTATGDDDVKNGVLEAFINQGKNLDALMLLMESLHKTGYNSNSSIDKNKKNSPAMCEFLQLTNSNTNANIVIPVSIEEREKFAAIFKKKVLGPQPSEMMDQVRWFVHIAQSTGYPLQQVLVQYYGWIKDFEMHDPAVYRTLKCRPVKRQKHLVKKQKRTMMEKQSRQQASVNYCFICEEGGGTLTVCDGCKKCHCRIHFEEGGTLMVCDGCDKCLHVRNSPEKLQYRQILLCIR